MGSHLGAPAKALPSHPRYKQLAMLEEGGMGEIHLVYDRELQREVVLKVVRACLDKAGHRRFLREARLAGSLQHPGIVPIYDLGLLSDGRPYFTMRRVLGRTLGEVAEQVHRLSDAQGWQVAGGWSLYRLMDALRRVAEAVGFAHDQGVIHRDLKPANVMIGVHGQVEVVDWGLAQLLAAVVDEDGTMLGTPGYMAPEQARGEISALGPSSDVFALGGMLRFLLTGQSPRQGDADTQLMDAQEEPLEELNASHLGAPIPEELADLAERACSLEQWDRPEDGASFARDLQAWLERVREQRTADDRVKQGTQLLPERGALLAQAAELRERARYGLDQAGVSAEIAQKRPLWALEDRAADLEREAARLAAKAENLAHRGLSHVPEHAGAHSLLSTLYRERHDQALAAADPLEAERYAVLVAEHARTPADRSWVRGTASVSLNSLPSVAVRVREVVAQGRAWGVGRVRGEGRTPFTAELEAGRYQIELAGLVIPLELTRGQHLDLSPPDRGPLQLGPLERWTQESGLAVVPAGYFNTGPGPHGDPGASLPNHKVWVESFAIDRDPVRLDAWIRFLDDLVQQGQQELALRCAPRKTGAPPGEGLLLGRTPEGGFAPMPDPEGDMWELDWPVFHIDWHSAMAYAAWRQSQDGLPWRLPSEVEWEKAARGDGRLYPWGDFFDPVFCNMRQSRGGPFPASVDAFPLDRSPYGVRGMGGNIREWCLEAPGETARALSLNNTLKPKVASSDQELRVLRGGNWLSPAQMCRSTFSHHTHADAALQTNGVRLLLPLTEL
jgi:serine/threonine-protein kinase